MAFISTYNQICSHVHGPGWPSHASSGQHQSSSLLLPDHSLLVYMVGPYFFQEPSVFSFPFCFSNYLMSLKWCSSSKRLFLQIWLLKKMKVIKINHLSIFLAGYLLELHQDFFLNFFLKFWLLENPKDTLFFSLI